MLATIKEVAQMAGVSISTVSHVINSTRHVNEDTKERVSKAIEALNYSPSAMARSLRKGATRTIGVISNSSLDSFFGEVFRGISEVCELENYDLIVNFSDINAEVEGRYVKSLLRREIDGLIMNAVSSDTSLHTILQDIEKPIMLFQRFLPGSHADTVESDDHAGFSAALGYLLSNGHKRIACVQGGTSETHTARFRTEVFMEILGECELLDESLIVDGGYNMDNAYGATRSLLERPDRPTAILYWSDPMALAGMAAARDLGLSIPGDCSFIGYDDLEICHYSNPRLTTVRQDKFRLGNLMARRVIDRIARPELEPKRITVPVELVIRESSGPAPNNH